MQKRYRKKRSPVKSFSEEIFKRSKRAIPHIIYPEILVIVDYDGYRLHGGDNIQVCVVHLIYNVLYSIPQLDSKIYEHIYRLKDILCPSGTVWIYGIVC